MLDDIIIGRNNIEKEIGEIMYNDLNNKPHIYYPDIYIKSINKIYEVINLLKQQAVLDKNINFEFMILNL